MSAPVIIMPPPQRRDCIAVEGRRYCRDEDVSARSVGLLIFLLLLLSAWALVPLVRDWSGKHAVAWYFGGPALLALLLVVFGGGK